MTKNILYLKMQNNNKDMTSSREITMLFVLGLVSVCLAAPHIVGLSGQEVTIPCDLDPTLLRSQEEDDGVIFCWKRKNRKLPVYIRIGGYSPYVSSEMEHRVNVVSLTSLHISPLHPNDQGWYACCIVAQSSEDFRVVNKRSVEEEEDGGDDDVDDKNGHNDMDKKSEVDIATSKYRNLMNNYNNTTLKKSKVANKSFINSNYYNMNNHKNKKHKTNNKNNNIIKKSKRALTYVSAGDDNDGGYTGTWVYLTVEVPAKVTSASKSVEIISEGQTAELFCHATGRPLPQITWLKNGRRLEIIPAISEKEKIVENMFEDKGKDEYNHHNKNHVFNDIVGNYDAENNKNNRKNMNDKTIKKRNTARVKGNARRWMDGKEERKTKEIKKRKKKNMMENMEKYHIARDVFKLNLPQHRDEKWIETRNNGGLMERRCMRDRAILKKTKNKNMCDGGTCLMERDYRAVKSELKSHLLNVALLNFSDSTALLHSKFNFLQNYQPFPKKYNKVMKKYMGNRSSQNDSANISFGRFSFFKCRKKVISKRNNLKNENFIKATQKFTEASNTFKISKRHSKNFNYLSLQYNNNSYSTRPPSHSLPPSHYLPAPHHQHITPPSHHHYLSFPNEQTPINHQINPLPLHPTTQPHNTPSPHNIPSPNNTSSLHNTSSKISSSIDPKENPSRVMKRMAKVLSFDFSIQILDVSLQDSGLYTCVLNNNAGSDQHHVKLIVQDSNRSYQDSQLFSDIPSNTTKEEWTRVKLPCKPHNPLYKVRWFRREFEVVRLPSFMHNLHIYADGSLVFNQASRQAMDWYTCAFYQNDTMVAETTVFLNITYLPRVVLQPRPLNDHLKTYNYHSYNPQPQANLNMKPHNNHHHFISNEDLYSQRLALNLTGRLYCPVEANPHNYVVLWYKGDLQLKMGNDPRYKMDFRTLTIKPVFKHDEGKYSCKPWNPQANTNRSQLFSVYVEDPPTLTSYPDNTYNTLVGDSVYMPCQGKEKVERKSKKEKKNKNTSHKEDVVEIEEEKKEELPVTWMKQHGSFPPSTRTLIDQGNLTLVRLESKDSGLYMCKVSNRVASMLAYTYLYVEEANKYRKASNLTAKLHGDMVVLSWIPAYCPTKEILYTLWYREGRWKGKYRRNNDGGMNEDENDGGDEDEDEDDGGGSDNDEDRVNNMKRFGLEDEGSYRSKSMWVKFFPPFNTSIILFSRLKKHLAFKVSWECPGIASSQTSVVNVKALGLKDGFFSTNSEPDPKNHADDQQHFFAIPTPNDLKVEQSKSLLNISWSHPFTKTTDLSKHNSLVKSDGDGSPNNKVGKPSFELQVRLGTLGEWKTLAKTNITHHTWKAVKRGSSYYFRVYCLLDDRASIASEIVSVFVSPDKNILQPKPMQSSTLGWIIGIIVLLLFFLFLLLLLLRRCVKKRNKKSLKTPRDLLCDDDDLAYENAQNNTTHHPTQNYTLPLQQKQLLLLPSQPRFHHYQNQLTLSTSTLQQHYGTAQFGPSSTKDSPDFDCGKNIGDVNNNNHNAINTLNNNIANNSILNNNNNININNNIKNAIKETPI